MMGASLVGAHIKNLKLKQMCQFGDRLENLTLGRTGRSDYNTGISGSKSCCFLLVDFYRFQPNCRKSINSKLFSPEIRQIFGHLNHL